MAAGKGRLGAFPRELLQPLIQAIGRLAQQKRLPKRAALVLLVSGADHWADVVQQLQLQAQRHGWAYSAGAFVRRQLQRLFARRSPA